MQPSSPTWSWRRAFSTSMIWLAESNPAGSTMLATCSWPLPRVDASSKHPTSNAHQEERRKLLLYEPRNRFVPQPSCHDYILGWKRNPVHSQLLIQAAIELSQTADAPFTFLFTSLKKQHARARSQITNIYCPVTIFSIVSRWWCMQISAMFNLQALKKR